MLLFNGHAGISPEMAVRLSQAFGRTPEGWLQLQMHYDLAQIDRQAARRLPRCENLDDSTQALQLPPPG